MLSKLLIGWALMGLCVVVHAIGVTTAVRWLRGLRRSATFLHQWTGIFVWLAGWIILLHLLEVTVWGLFYLWKDAMPDLASALYFSAVTYTTTGYGDLVLPAEWRLLGAIEALTGILMCGWSTGFFFAIVSRMWDAPVGER
jgi:ion channel